MCRRSTTTRCTRCPSSSKWQSLGWHTVGGAKGMNRTQLIGRVGSAPEGGPSKGGIYARFSLATHGYWADPTSGIQVERTEWHQLVCYDRLADLALQSLKIGCEIYAEGRLRSSQRRGQGKGASQWELRVDELKVLRAPSDVDRVLRAAQALASIESLTRDAATGSRPEVSIGDLASLLGAVRQEFEEASVWEKLPP